MEKQRKARQEKRVSSSFFVPKLTDNSIFEARTESEEEDKDENSSPEGSSYKDSDRDDNADSWFDDDIDEGEEEDLEEEYIIPTKKSPKCSLNKSSPLHLARAAKKKAAATIADITTDMDNMGVDSIAKDCKSFDMSFAFPRMRYQYIFQKIKRENFEFFVPLYPNDHFKPWVHPSGCCLIFQTRVVPVFVHPNQQLFAMTNKASHNQDTHSNTGAFQEVTKEIGKAYDKEIWSEPITYPLKFQCKTNKKGLIFDVQSFPNNTVSVDEFGGQQWFAVLCICCTSIEEPEPVNNGTRRLVEEGDSLDSIKGFSTPMNAGAAAAMEENDEEDDYEEEN